MARKRNPPGPQRGTDQQNRDDMALMLNDTRQRVDSGDTHGLMIIELQRDGMVQAVHSQMTPHTLDRLEGALGFALSLAQNANDLQGYSN